MKPQLTFKDILLIITIIVFVASTFIRDNYYLNITVIIACCLVFFIRNILNPIKSIFLYKRFKFSIFVKIMLNLGIIIMLLLYIVFFPYTELIITLMLLFICDIILDFFVNKNRDLNNYIILLIILLNLFIRI